MSTRAVPNRPLLAFALLAACTSGLCAQDGPEPPGDHVVAQTYDARATDARADRHGGSADDIDVADEPHGDEAHADESHADDHGHHGTSRTEWIIFSVFSTVIVLTYLGLNAVLLVWMVPDAKAHGVDATAFWCGWVMVFGLGGLIGYLYMRPGGFTGADPGDTSTSVPEQVQEMNVVNL